MWSRGKENIRLRIGVAAGLGAAIVVFVLAATALGAGASPAPTPASNAMATPTAMGTAQHTATRTPFPTPNPFPPPILNVNFWIAVSGVPNCNTKNGDASCDLAPGTTFVIETHLDPLPSGVPEYGGFDIALRHTGVTPNHDASTNAWPDCSFPAAAYDLAPDTDIVAFGCAVGVPPAGPSTYAGLIGTVSFVCAGSGSVILMHGDGVTDLVDFNNIALHYFEDPNTSEALTINCVQPDPSALSLPNTGSTSGRQDNVWRLTVVASCAGAALFAAGAWSARRRRA